MSAQREAIVRALVLLGELDAALSLAHLCLTDARLSAPIRLGYPVAVVAEAEAIAARLSAASPGAPPHASPPEPS